MKRRNRKEGIYAVVRPKIDLGQRQRFLPHANIWLLLTGKVAENQASLAILEMPGARICLTHHGRDGRPRSSGAVSVSNLIEVKPRVAAGDVKQKILDALKRNAELEADAIRVSVIEGKVVLEGKVKAWHERGLLSMLRGPRPESELSKTILRSAETQFEPCSAKLALHRSHPIYSSNCYGIGGARAAISI